MSPPGPSPELWGFTSPRSSPTPWPGDTVKGLLPLLREKWTGLPSQIQRERAHFLIALKGFKEEATFSAGIGRATGVCGDPVGDLPCGPA